jgi:hypothetical protein
LAVSGSVSTEDRQQRESGREASIVAGQPKAESNQGAKKKNSAAPTDADKSTKKATRVKGKKKKGKKKAAKKKQLKKKKQKKKNETEIKSGKKTKKPGRDKIKTDKKTETTKKGKKKNNRKKKG